jgi:hypothetical protein
MHRILLIASFLLTHGRKIVSVITAVQDRTGESSSLLKQGSRPLPLKI